MDIDDEKFRQAYGASRHGFDFFKDSFATVRKGNLPSGKHADARMNVSIKDMNEGMKDW